MEKPLPLCRECYKSENKPKKSDSGYSGKTLSSTAIGKVFDLSATKINQILAELGWIMKYTKGWKSTPAGIQKGAQDREMRTTGIPYVIWPNNLIENKIFVRSIRDFKGEKVDEHESEESTETEANLGFREKFPCKYRATDGHMVRSRAEVMIDNFLYANKIVHAFERKLPIEEDLYCDFYLPEGKVYIEYWGLENDPKYQARKEEKIRIYSKYNYNLVELNDNHIKNLDDYLPKLLLPFGISAE